MRTFDAGPTPQFERRQAIRRAVRGDAYAGQPPRIADETTKPIAGDAS